MRFQQLTGPVMAKGVEDTAFYRYNRLVALNEVGGDPGRFGVSVSDFHAANARVAQRWPRTMLAGTTHDTKRSEDVRARLALLSELPHEWATTVRAWAALNAPRRTAPALPDGNLEYLIYQTLVGTWPITRDRLAEYLTKAMREAKDATTWSDPNEEYETAVLAFVDGALDDAEFVASLDAFVARLAPAWQVSALAQTLLRLTSPGVPDIYQGTELWDLSLVDPDNRRPVDFEKRRDGLRRVRAMNAAQALAEMDSGLAKMWLIERALHVGATGGYEPLPAQGEKADNLVAFVRGGRAITIAPRFVARLNAEWAGTTLAIPAGEWRDALSGAAVSGGVHQVSELLAQFPMALLVRADA
jgi:(1->4)-alpha-D-glucan 1-alpha-D-glucosylmutase